MQPRMPLSAGRVLYETRLSPFPGSRKLNNTGLWKKLAHLPKSEPVSAITENIEMVANLEQQFLSSRTAGDRIADAIAAFSGSIRFVIVHLVCFALWILLNTDPSHSAPV